MQTCHTSAAMQASPEVCQRRSRLARREEYAGLSPLITLIPIRGICITWGRAAWTRRLRSAIAGRSGCTSGKPSDWIRIMRLEDH